MTELSRRSVLAMGAGATAALAMPQLMVRAAWAQSPTVPTPGFSSFKLGDWQVTTVLDGLRPGEGPHPIFGENQPAEAVAELMQQNLLPADRFVNSFSPTLLDTGSEVILFDTGLGAGGRENGLGQLRARLEQAGYPADRVSVVVITHMHGDHIGGLMENGSPAFPNARHVLGRTEYEFWTAPERMSGPTEGGAKAVAANVKLLAEKATMIGDGDAVVPGVTAIAAPGHTPGHLIFHLESGGKRLLLTADTANHFVASLQRPDWHVRFDMDKEQAAQTRRKVFDMIAADRVPFIGYHMPFPAVGYVEKMDGGYRYVPESYQLDLQSAG